MDDKIHTDLYDLKTLEQLHSIAEILGYQEDIDMYAAAIKERKKKEAKNGRRK